MRAYLMDLKGETVPCAIMRDQEIHHLLKVG